MIGVLLKIGLRERLDDQANGEPIADEVMNHKHYQRRSSRRAKDVPAPERAARQIKRRFDQFANPSLRRGLRLEDDLRNLDLADRSQGLDRFFAVERDPGP